MPLKNKKQSMASHLKQFKNPLYSTIGLEKFLDKHGCFNAKRVLDVGCGCGAVTNYMARKHPSVRFEGLDYNKYLIKKGKKIPANNALNNLELSCGDLFKLPPRLKKTLDGIYNVHTLCCLKRMEPVMDSLANLEPRWIAFNSLFYEGPLDTLIHIRDYKDSDITDDNPDGDFNIFSLPLTKKYLEKKGYKYFFYERFEIPKRLKKPPIGKRGTYTIKTEISPRTQFSGPVYLPWYFVLAKKSI